MKLLLVPIVFLFAVGCGKAKEKTAAEKLVDDAEANAAAYCKCGKDDACLAEVTKKGAANDEALKKETITPELQKRMDAIEAKVTACAADQPPPVEPDKVDTAAQDKFLADATALRDAVCACKDKACFDVEIKKGDGFEDQMKAIWKDEASIPADINTKIEALKQAVMDCAGKLGAGQAPATPPPSGDAAAEATKVLDEMAALTDEICKCADMACAQPFGEKIEPLEQKLHDLYPDRTTVPAEMMTRGEEIEKKMGDCVAKFPQ